MEATFKIKESEFDYAFFKKLKGLFRGQTISIGVNTDQTSNSLEAESEYFEKISKAVDRIEKDESTVKFTADEFDEFVNKLSNSDQPQETNLNFL